MKCYLDFTAISICCKSLHVYSLFPNLSCCGPVTDNSQNYTGLQTTRSAMALNPFSIPDIYQAISMSVIGTVSTTTIWMTGLKPLSDAEMNEKEAGLLQSDSIIK